MRMGTRVKPLHAAFMCLPGFGPGEDPLAMTSIPQETSLATTSTITLEPRPMAVRPTVVKLHRKVWPSLSEGDMAPEGMAPTERIEANLAALRAAKQGGGTRQDLTRYTGWGAIPAVFDDAKYATQREALKGLLSEEEYEAARASVNTSFFTPYDVCEAMWHWIGQTGFTGGRILEPSAGIGNLIGTMPKEIAEASTVTAIEKDQATADILRSIYGPAGVKVHCAGFESVALPEGGYDLVISNVPFGDFGVAETRNKDYKNWLIHDYFFGKSMEVVRPGGLVAFLTTRGTLDKATTSHRRWLSIHADLVAAVRLPIQTFKGYAGTEACVDLVILQRKAKPEEAKVEWIDLKEFRPNGYGSNAYANPVFGDGGKGRVVGELKRAYTRYGYQVQADSADWKTDLAKAVAEYAVPACYTPVVVEQKRVTRRVEIAKHKPGCYVIVDGVLMMSLGHEAEPVALSKDEEARVMAMLPVRETVRALVKAQVLTDEEAPLEALRLQLHTQYDAFTKAFGSFNDKKNVKALGADADFSLLRALEKVDESGVVTKADLFYRRTARATVSPTSASTLAEAVQVNLAEAGHLQVGRLAGLMGWSMDEVIAGLTAESLAFQCPSTHAWQPAFAYLSGDVKSKLAEAEAAGQGYEANVAALKAVIPADIPAQDIAVRLGANWIPGEVYMAFAKEILNVKEKVAYVKAAGLWTVTEGYGANPNFGTKRVDACNLFRLALNQKEPEVRDRDTEGNYYVNVPETLAAKEKQQAIREAFAKWIWAEEDRKDKLVRCYNDVMNRHVETEWDGNLLTLPGFSDCVKLHKHQRDAIWRMVVSGRNTLLAQCVGSGKTLSMICAGMEMRRTGKAKKPMYVVPNHMLEQFAVEFMRAYPGASVLLATKDDLAKERRHRLTAKIALWDWDAIVITHSSFEKITASERLVKSYIKENLVLVETAALAADDRSRKEIEAMKASLESKLEKLTAKDRKDDLLEFKELGVDQLFVDEAHCFARETPVLTETGYVPIGDLVDGRVDTKVASVCLETGALEWRRITDWVSSESREALIRVVHEGGYFDCTPDHEIWTWEDGYVEAKRLTESHSLQVLRGVSSSQAESGSTENVGTERARVVRVEALEQGRFGESRRDCGESQKVYCLEVEGNNNFFAGGALVSNCFKNVWRFTRMTRIAGLPITDSQRAFDMLMKVREIEEIRGDRQGVVFATGTPVANSVAECWVMANYLQHRTLEAHGFGHFDTWAANFGEAVTGIELRPDGGGYRVNTRFARFINLPEWMGVFKDVADIKTKEMLNLPTPEVIRETVAAKCTPTLKAFVQTLVDRVEAIQAGKVKPYEDNMLAVTNDGRKAATDMRLVGGQDEPGSKINRCVEKLLNEWRDTADRKGTQIVFLDLSTPGAGKHWSLYDDMRDKLIAAGVPKDEIAFIHDANTDKAKETLFAKVRAGTVRILFGSTSKMGVGTNVQTRLVALHHVDPTYRPCDIEQREGRIERQGNLNASVRIYRYVTEGSFDAYMWQTLETKAKFIAQIMSGGALRTAEDLEMAALSYAEVKALASGNPLVIEKAGVDAEVNRLTLLRKQWTNQNGDLRWDVRTIPASIESAHRRLKAANADVAKLEDVRGSAFSIVLNDKVITDRKEAASKLLLAIYEANPHRGPQVLGTYAGLELSVEATLGGTRLALEGETRYTTTAKLTPANVLSELLELVRDIEMTPKKVEYHLQHLEERLARAKSMLSGAAWEHEEKYAELLARQAMIDAQLGIGQSAQVAFEEESEKA